MNRKTIETYNTLSNEYDKETVDFWNNFPRTFFDRFFELSGTKILDVGSGPGRDGLLLKNSGKEVICLDASEEMVRLSTERGLVSILGDFNALPFGDKEFDGVWSYTALLHVPKSEIDTPFSEIHRVLKNKGVFGLGLIEGTSEGYRESSGVNLPRWFSFYEKEEVETIAKKYGFKTIYFESFKPHTKNYLNFIFRKE